MDAQFDYYNIALIAGFSVIILGIILGWGENRKIVVFSDYNDLGLTFLIPASFLLINLLYIKFFGGDPQYSMILSGVVSGGLLILLIINTFKDNGNNPFKALLALVTKVPLAIIWILNLFNMLNPSGKNARQRSQNRGIAIFILTILTPIIAMLVVDKQGSVFNPKTWLKGRRGVGSIRNHL